jgi:hypothetical protein
MESSKKSAFNKSIPSLYSIETLLRLHINFDVLNMSIDNISKLPVMYGTTHAQPIHMKQIVDCLFETSKDKIMATYNLHIQRQEIDDELSIFPPLASAGSSMSIQKPRAQTRVGILPPSVREQEQLEQKHAIESAFRRKRKEPPTQDEPTNLTSEDIENLQWVLYPRKNSRNSIYYDKIHPVDLPHIIMYRCKHCSKILKSRSAILYHAHSHIPGFVYKYKCSHDECDFKTEGLKDMVDHMASIHKNKSQVFITNDTSVNKSLWTK